MAAVWPDYHIVYSKFGNLQHWNLPKSTQIVPKRVENEIILKYIPKDFKIFAKAVEFAKSGHTGCLSLGLELDNNSYKETFFVLRKIT